MNSGWRYYNHALLPNCAPNCEVNISGMEDKAFWVNNKGKAIMARWTSDFDCSRETEWWYVIKDDSYDISQLKSKRRYEINKGKKAFTVELIDAKEYIADIIQIQRKAYEEYPEHYRPTVDNEKVRKEVEAWGPEVKIFGAFSTEGNQLSGYAMCIEYKTYTNFAMLKVMPECERNGINAAMVDAILEHYKEKISKEYFVCDGERSLFHETNFQDYLEKYFGFRKAYCQLHVKFRFPYSAIINVLSLLPQNWLRGKSISKVKVLVQYQNISNNCIRK